ncbi:hypothetical protein ACFU0Y_11890, partial [Kocuria sp. NPDC057446]
MAAEDEVRDGAAPDAEPVPAQPPAPAGPAPVIDLGGDGVPVRPVKPLGPRRLARLQRELEERSRELAEAGSGPADPELFEKQRRFAELAAQAEAAQPGAGAALQEPVLPESPAPGTGTPPEDPQEPREQITVVFPDGGPAGPDGHVSPDPVHVDPALFTNRLAPEDLAALTHIEIVAPTEVEHHGSHAVRRSETARAGTRDTGAVRSAGSGHHDPGT